MSRSSSKPFIYSMIKTFDVSVRQEWMDLLCANFRAAELLIILFMKADENNVIIITVSDLANSVFVSKHIVHRAAKYLAANGYIEDNGIVDGTKSYHNFKIADYTFEHMRINKRDMLTVQYAYEERKKYEKF